MMRAISIERDYRFFNFACVLYKRLVDLLVKLAIKVQDST